MQSWEHCSRSCILSWQEACMRLLGRSSCLGFKTSLLSVPAVLFLILSHPFRLHLMNPEIPGFCLTSGSKFYHACQNLGTPKSSQLPCLALSFPPRLPLALLVLSFNLWPIASQSFIALVEYSLTQQLRPCICHAVIFFNKPLVEKSVTITFIIIIRLGLT